MHNSLKIIQSWTCECNEKRIDSFFPHENFVNLIVEKWEKTLIKKLKWRIFLLDEAAKKKNF